MTDRNNIEQLFKTHYARMLRVAVMIIHDDDLARDIVHDVFASLLACSGDFLPSESYLLKAVRNRCLNHIKSLSVRDRMKELYAVDEQEIADDEWPDDETIAMIHSTVANDLTDACRRVVNMRFAEGMSYKEISATLGISEVAVYKHLRHAIDVLRSKLSQNG